MKKSLNSGILIVVSCLLVGTLGGCDLLGLGPKKPVKKEIKAEEVVVVAPQTANTAPVNEPLSKNTLVRIGKWSLTMDEFNERLRLLKQGVPEFNENDANAKQLVLDELIRQQLLVQDAEDQDIANEKQIKDAVDDFRKTLVVQEVANRLTKNVSATEDEALKYYNENKDLFVEPIKWKVSEIVVPDEATAKTILVQILQGTDFAGIAKTQSKGATAARGGQLKEFTKAPFDAMQKSVLTLDVGGVSGVIKGPQGYYIVKIDSKNGGSMKAFADVKTQLISGLTLRKQQQVVLDHLNKLAEKNKIEINKELLGEPAVK